MNCPEIVKNTRLTVILGAYGSGKSEISVNVATALRSAFPQPQKILLADLDIVNPFYRSADARELLESSGIRVVAPDYAKSNVDAPVLPGEVYVIFDDEEYKGVFDIGGEDMGAVVLGSLRRRLENTDHRILMAVNTLRPFTSDAPQIAEMTAELCAASGFPIDGYINNTNLLGETTPEIIAEGEKIILEASELTGIPLLVTSYMDGIEGIDGAGFAAPEVFVMDRRIHYDY